METLLQRRVPQQTVVATPCQPVPTYSPAQAAQAGSQLDRETQRLYCQLGQVLPPPLQKPAAPGESHCHHSAPVPAGPWGALGERPQDAPGLLKAPAAVTLIFPDSQEKEQEVALLVPAAAGTCEDFGTEQHDSREPCAVLTSFPSLTATPCTAQSWQGRDHAVPTPSTTQPGRGEQACVWHPQLQSGSNSHTLEHF